MLLAIWRNPAPTARVLFLRTLMIALLVVSGLSPAIALQRNARDEAVRKRSMQSINPAMPRPMKIDPQRVAAAGISVLRGKHITLYTLSLIHI